MNWKFWNRKKIVISDITPQERANAIKKVKQNPLFVDSLNKVIDYELGELNKIWWGEQDNDTLRAFQGQAYALYKLKSYFLQNPVRDAKEA